ncbi:unnamed protein product [Rotaria socialis]|uniref:RNA-directed DNA polymerase n=1 Tax=Rotaria socialis TaxID=392032 RepID=A0A818XYS7_9BILA|nr:unnamed protein product [Rotaria socialis]
MDDETTPSGTTEVPPPVSTASATGTTQVPDQSNKIGSSDTTQKPPPEPKKFNINTLKKDEAIAELKKAIALLNKKDTDIQIINAQYSKLNQEKSNLEDNLIQISNIKDQACHDVQDFTARQIALEQEIHDARAEQQRLLDLADNEKQQQADAEADRIRYDKNKRTSLHGAYMALPRSTKDLVMKILSDHNLTVMTASNDSLEMAIASAEIAAELSAQSVKDELKKHGIPLFPSGSPIHTSQTNTSTTPAISTAITSTQGIPIYTSTSSVFNLIPPHSSPNRIVITHPATPPSSPPPFQVTMTHSTPDPNAPVKSAVELEVEKILNEPRRQLQSDTNINLNLKPVSTKQTKYQRDCINRTNILVKFCDTSDDFDSFYTKISLYYGLKKTDNKFISEKDVILQKFKGDTLSQFLYHIEKFHKYSLQYFQKDETRFQVELEKTLIGSCLEHIMDGIPEEHNSYMLTIKTMIEFLASKNIKIIDREDIFSICPKIDNESVTDIRNRLKINYGISHPNENHENANELINKFYSFLNIDLCKKLKNKIIEQETWSNNKATFSQISNLAIILETEMNSPSNNKTKVFYQEPSQRQSRYDSSDHPRENSRDRTNSFNRDSSYKYKNSSYSNNNYKNSQQSRNYSKERDYSKSPNSSYSNERKQSYSPKSRNNSFNYKYPESKTNKKDFSQTKKPYVRQQYESQKERSKSPSYDRRHQTSSKSPERSYIPRSDKHKPRSTSRDKSPEGATANIPSLSSKEIYLCQKCKNISIGNNKCSICLSLCHYCKKGNHYIKQCREYKVIRKSFSKNPKNNFNIKYKEDLIQKCNNTNNNDKFNIACSSNNEPTSVIIPNITEVPKEPEVPKVKKVKKLNKNGNNKIFNKLIKQTPEVFLNPEQLDNFPIPTLKSSIKSNDPLNSRKKKVSFNKVNKCVKYGSFWEPIKLSETSVEKKVFVKFNKKIYNVNYVIDINELKSKTIKFYVLNNLKNNFNIDAKILQNSVGNNGNEIKKENLNLHETANNTINNKSDNNINLVSKGINYTFSSINYSYLLHNPDKPVKSTISPTETISVNFSSILENNKFDNLNLKSCLTKNNKYNINLDSENKLINYSLKNNYNKFNIIIDEINDYSESSIYYKYKLFHLNSEKLIKFKFLFCQLNQFVNNNYFNINMYFNNSILNNNLDKIYKMVNLSINNDFNNFDLFNYNLSVFNIFNKNKLIYLYIALNYFNTYVFNSNNFNQIFLNILELNICNQIQVRLNNIVEGTGINCKDHNCNQYTFGNPTKEADSMESNILNILTRKQQELAINGIPRQNYWILANKDKHPVRSANRPDILTFFISINDKPCICLIDSGAQMSSMTKAGLKYFDIPCKELPPGKYNSLGMGGITPITHVAQANVVCHDLMFPKHSFKIINNSNPDYYVTLGSDWLQENKIIIDPFNLSIGCQIDKESYWELMCNCKLKLCRRILRNIPVYCYEGVTPREQYETLSHFNINLPDVKIIENKNCLCNEPTMDKLNNFIYFISNYNDVDNSEKHNYKINIDENTGKIIDNMLIKDTMTNIHNSQFSIIKNLNANYCKLNRGTLIGTVSSPLCNENDKNFPVRLNNSLLTRDIELKNENIINKNEASIRFNNLNNNILNDLYDINALKNLNNIIHYKYSNNVNVQYDLMAPAVGEETKADDPDLPDKSTWTKETLNSKLNIQSKDINHVNKLQELLFQHNEVFSQTDFSKEASLDPLTVELTDQIPIFIPQYKFQPDIEDAVQRKVDELIAQKQIVPSKSRYNFPILPIKKRTGTNTADNIRIVLDLRLLNKKAIKFDYPIPDISILLQKLGGFNLYTSLDFTNSFWQLPLDEKSQDYMSFSLARGKYKLTRAPQGFINTAAAFQSSMNYVFGDLLFNKELPVKTYVNGVPKWTNISRTRLISYIDDVIILAESEQVMELMLELVLKKLTEYQLKLKISKCIFSSIKLDFVGHEISKDGIRKQPKYVTKVLQVPRPEKIKDLLKFMGMANWVMKFCKNFSEIARPLSALQKTDKKSMKQSIEWTEERIKSFEAIKELIKEDITLAYPLPDNECGELQLFCDASENCIGSTLCQYQPLKNKDGKEELVLRTIANYSCVLNKHARNYNIREKELTAIRLSLEHYKPYLIGRPFCIWSDHRSLIYLNTMKLINTRLFRTAEEMACFDYKICYIPGKDNFYADIMSRLKYDQMIDKATKNHSDKIPDNMNVIEIPGGGDSLVHALSLILFEWKRQEGKISNYEIFSTEYYQPLREKLQKHIYSNPERYGITLNKENRREWQSYALQGVTLKDEFIQCFVNLYRCEIELYFSNTSPVIFQCDDPKKIQQGKIGRLQIKGGTHFNVLKNVKPLVNIEKTHIMFHKKLDKIKNNSNNLIDEI